MVVVNDIKNFLFMNVFKKIFQKKFMACIFVMTCHKKIQSMIPRSGKKTKKGCDMTL